MDGIFLATKMLKNNRKLLTKVVLQKLKFSCKSNIGFYTKLKKKITITKFNVLSSEKFKRHTVIKLQYYLFFFGEVLKIAIIRLDYCSCPIGLWKISSQP